MSRGATPDADEVLQELRRQGTKAQRDSLARYGIVANTAVGVSVGALKKYAKTLGRSHALADALWNTEVYEARMLASMVDEPARVTPAQMDRWCRAFDNWAICDTVCFHLFDRTPHAWGKVEAWATREKEFVKRGAFALVWGLTVHDKAAEDARFIQALAWIEAGAEDDRHYVKKAVNMALRAIGKRNAALRKAARVTAEQLAESEDDNAQWVGRDALRELKLKPLKNR
jgi:3-methyladenine DNA glycosylase AlkD